MKTPTFSESEMRQLDKVGLAPLPCTYTVAPATKKSLPILFCFKFSLLIFIHICNDS